MLGPDGKPLDERAAGTTPRRSPRTAARVYVGIERVHQIVRFDYRQATACARAASRSPCRPACKTLPHNQGIECLAVAAEAACRSPAR